ncbi:MAG: pyridoxal 5'-phosphate synthase glutaminase subunit PdxT [Candidatus Thermoplasmatota archaeon]
MKIGVLGAQGAVLEHEKALKRTLEELEIDAGVKIIRSRSKLENLDGLVIPGGESSTISRILDRKNMREEIISKAEEGMHILGTCAGAILLASEGGKAVEDSDTRLLELMDMKVERNAFGRQKRSFESYVDIDKIGKRFPGVFIRAPMIEECWGSCTPLAELEDIIVAAEQSNLLALVFHPELTSDLRIHRYFIEKVCDGK